ncbi:MAG: hypothetical protein NDI69_06650 [Bacteriovoracaceae bacterium]|nr:hypothetical protein [Bacteriovoracaceae bacterium]
MKLKKPMNEQLAVKKAEKHRKEMIKLAKELSAPPKEAASIDRLNKEAKRLEKSTTKMMKRS